MLIKTEKTPIKMRCLLKVSIFFFCKRNKRPKEKISIDPSISILPEKLISGYKVFSSKICIRTKKSGIILKFFTIRLEFIMFRLY